MNCREFKRKLDDGEALEGEAEAHLESCDVCRALVDEEQRLVRGLRALEEEGSARETGLSFEAVRDATREESSWTRTLDGLGRASRFAVVVSAVFAVAAVLWIWFPRPDLGDYPPTRFWGIAGGFVLTIAASGFAGLRPVYRRSLGFGATTLLAAVVVGYGIVVGSLPLPHQVEPFAQLGDGAKMVPLAATCFAYGAMYAAPPAVAAWLTIRSVRPLLDRIVLVAVATGAAGHFGLHLNCPLVQSEHLLLGHATVPVVYGAVAAAAVYSLDRGE